MNKIDGIQKNEDHIWSKNKMLRDKIERKINSIKDLRPNTSQLKKNEDQI